jgi:hypothetical protein
MTAYRFRVKFDPDPRSLWRDVAVGADRSLDEFQTAINAAMGLDQGHLWFFGVDEDYWRSVVKYQCPQEFDDSSSSGLIGFDEESHDAGETSVGEMAEHLGLNQYDRICYLYDYGDEWRFYAILKECMDDESNDRGPEVVAERGEAIEQYAPIDDDPRRVR